MSFKGKIKKFGENQNIGEFLLNYSLYFVLLAMIIIVIIINPAFISIRNVTNILSQASTRLIIAMGVAGLIVLQGTDLSAGRIMGICAIISASLMQAYDYGTRMYPDLPQMSFGLRVLTTILIAVLIGAIFGAINGFGVAKLKVHAFIISLGTQLIVYGFSCMYIDRPPYGAQPIAGFDPKYKELVNGVIKLGEYTSKNELGVERVTEITLPYLIIYAAIVSLVMWFIWNKTKLGKNLFAIGGNPDAAAVSGVDIVKNIMIIFIMAGALYGLAGFLEAARIGSTTSATGMNYELDAIAGCVVGGVSFSGGVGTIPGIIIGVVILQFINYGLTFIEVSPYLQFIIKGLIIIMAVSIDVRKNRIRK